MAALRHLRARIAAHLAVKPGGSKGKDCSIRDETWIPPEFL
jgi:hypothetical protein